VGYGQEFQRRLVPNLEEKMVVSLERTGGGFTVRLDDGEQLQARQVIVAVGISHFHYLPPVFSGLPTDFVTHTSFHNNFDQFRGREVTVIGSGSSAADVAAALHQAGADTQMVARRPEIRFHSQLQLPRPLMESIKAPMTGLGPGWRSLMCTKAPLLFHKMPAKFRLEIVRRHLGPAPGWFVKDQIVGQVPFQGGVQIRAAKVQDGRVHLELVDHDGVARTLVTDHVIAGTGYRVDLQRLTFLSPEFRASIRSLEQTPVLSTKFESSVPGLYFVGAASANSFGPLARFAYGAGFTSRRLSAHLARLASRKLVGGVALAGAESLRQ
jgi:thioredoxin reductase